MRYLISKNDRMPIITDGGVAAIPSRSAPVDG